MPVFRLVYSRIGVMSIQASDSEKAQDVLREYLGVSEDGNTIESDSVLEEFNVDDWATLGGDELDAELREDAEGEQVGALK